MSKIYTITEINEIVKNLLENDSRLFNIVLKGEISNFKTASSGHMYFSLKDENSQINCTLFKFNTYKLRFIPKNGDQVLAYGNISTYIKNGSYSINISFLEPYGLGKYLLEMEALKNKLKDEGLFDKPKKYIPLFPKKIGIITSKTGAAIHDFIDTIMKRFPTTIYVFPCSVQGDDAPKSIIKALEQAYSYNLDVILIGRGGGSIEDLMAFNDEFVVRKVSESNIPIISAVGHQIDTTLIDYVADKVGITPTDAAALATPILRDDLIQSIDETVENGKIYIKQMVERYKESIKNYKLIIKANSPKHQIQLKRERIQNYLLIGRQSIQKELFEYKGKIEEAKKDLNRLELTKQSKDTIRLLTEKLQIVNPQNIIDKGYSVVRDKNNKIINSINDISPNDELFISFKDGVVKSKVISKGDK